VTKWFLLAMMICATVAGDVLQSFEMKRHGEISDFRPSGIKRHLYTMAQRRYLILAVFFMAISFFVFMKLLKTADMSFVVPASAGSFVFETVLAKFVLKERVSGRRWAGACLVACGVALVAQ
jgi:drug/metabolite transporter (DMT)-like permease